jgi:hypothetical protein
MKCEVSSFNLLPPAFCLLPLSVIFLYIESWKKCPLQLKIKMRAVDKTLISN